jgi:GT2 family glycosyltransferase
MKKTIMRVLRAALQIIPKNVKDKLKQSERLTSLYVRSVRKAGLFYDAPTPKQTRELYRQWLDFQDQSESYFQQHETPWQIIIFTQQDSEGIDGYINYEKGNCRTFVFNVNGNLNFNDILQQLNVEQPVLLLNEGDQLATHANHYFCNVFDGTGADILYCDTDSLNEVGEQCNPCFLPDWNPELLFSTAYIKSGVLLMPNTLRRLEDEAFKTISGAVAHLALSIRSIRIEHIAFPLVHTKNQQTLLEQELKDIAKSLYKHTDAKLNTDLPMRLNQVLWESSTPLVSLLIPTKNSKALVKACIDSILEKTTYSNYEILLLDNGSDEQDSLMYFDYLDTLDKVTVLKYDEPFNYSAINNFGVKHAKGSIIGLINNDIEVISPDWLTYMVGHAERESIGCVGAKLLYSDTRIQHAGVVLGYGGGAGHAHKNFPRMHSGYLNRINATSNYSAVTAACLIVKRSIFERVDGLNEKDLAVAFNDVDFCLKVRELGLQNVYCAEAELFHHESVSRGLDVSPEKAARFNRELNYLQETWKKYIEYDPAYSPNLTLKRENFSIKTLEELKASST